MRIGASQLCRISEPCRTDKKKDADRASSAPKPSFSSTGSSSDVKKAEASSVATRALAMPETREELVDLAKQRAASGYYNSDAMQGEIADSLLGY